jgi:hypothetical protein
VALSNSEIEALLSSEKSDALSSERASSLSEDRARAMDYYLGDVSDDMPSEPDRSSAVSSDVSDTIDGLMPGLMEIFYGGDKVVEFEPQGPEDEEAADQETDYINYVFQRQNDGFRVLYSMIKDALLQKLGIVKVWWEEKEADEEESYRDLDDAEFAMLMEDDNIEIVEHDERVDPAVLAMVAEASNQLADQAGVNPDAIAAQVDGPVQIPPEVQLPKIHDVVIRYTKTITQTRVEPVPPEEFGCSRRAKSVRTSDYCFHETRRTVADLLDEGYDEDVIEKLSTADFNDSEEAQSRDTVNDTADHASSGANKANRMVLVTEHYVRMNMEEGKNDKAALYKIVTGGEGETILEKDGEPDIEKVKRMPFAAMTPIIMPHRLIGRSIADLVIDIQRIKTSLIRSLLDNMYLANNQRIEIAESHAGDNTIDDILTNRPGGVIRTKTPGGLMPVPNQSIGPFGFPLMEYYDGVREWRTGVTKQGMGLDPNALQNIGENAILEGANAARAKQKLIARVFAETGIRDMFLLIHATVRDNDDKENTIRLRGKWVAINPREWKYRSDMTVNVGLGEGSKQQQLAFLAGLLQIQEKAMANAQLGLIKPKHLYNTLEKFVELGGLRSVEPYFQDPEEKGPDGQLLNPPQPPPPDPKIVELEKRMELEKTQGEAEIAANDRKTQADIQLKEREFDLKREMMLLEAQLKAAEHNRKMLMEINAEGMDEEAGLSPYNTMIDSLETQAAAVANALVSVQSQLRNADVLARSLAQTSLDVNDAVSKIQAHVQAPAEVVRDENNRIVGVRKNGIVQTIARDESGSISGLQ